MFLPPKDRLLKTATLSSVGDPMLGVKLVGFVEFPPSFEVRLSVFYLETYSDRSLLMSISKSRGYFCCILCVFSNVFLFKFSTASNILAMSLLPYTTIWSNREEFPLCPVLFMLNLAREEEFGPLRLKNYYCYS